MAVGEDVPQAAKSPITAHITKAAMINRLLVFDSNRRTFGRPSRLAMITEADESGEGGGVSAAPAPPEPPSTGGPDVALETGRAETVSWGLVES